MRSFFKNWWMMMNFFESFNLSEFSWNMTFWNQYLNFHQNFQQNFQQKSCNIQWSFKQDQNKSKFSLFISKHDYCRENNFCFKCSFSNHSARDCKFFFNFNQMSVKNDNIKLQFYKIWARKHTRIQILCASNFSDNNKSNHDVHIITDKDYKSDSDKSCKCLKN